jgi:hypothetical protein
MYYIFLYGSLLLLPWPLIEWAMTGNAMVLKPIGFDASGSSNR